MPKFTSIGVIAFKRTKKTIDICARIQEWSRRREIPVCFHSVMRGMVDRTCRGRADFLRKSQVIVSVGGDGTLLSAVHMCGFSARPLLGINAGGLGFLTDIGVEDIEEGLTNLVAGRFQLKSRMVLAFTVKRRNRIIARLRALNDIFFNRQYRPELLSLEAWYGKNFITTFQGDGAIVATPGGSTAYSLAAGGPIVELDCDTLILTPVCPHSLTERPLILPTNENIRLVIEKHNPRVLLSADGLDPLILHPGDEVTIGCSSERTTLVHLSGHSYFELLRRKLDWGQNFKQRE